MAVRTITTSLKLDGEKEFKKELSSVNGELRNLKSDLALTTEEFKGNANSMEALSAKSKILNREVEQQKEKVQALERALKESAEVYGEADSRTDKYRQSLNRAKTDLIKMSRELDETDKYLDEAKSSTDKAAKSIDRFGREVKDAGEELDDLRDFDFNSLLEGLEGLKGLGAAAGVAATAGAMKGLADGILEVEEATREYRTIMGTLQVSSEAAGYSADQTKEAYERLYGVLGDTQTTATTVANLQAIGLSQQDLMYIIDATTGAWATYGDSIPIDGLAEAINETIQVGKVTGTFADVLNWAGTSEDDFNAKLQSANSTTERAQIVLEELTEQGLNKAGEAWRDVNDDIVAANEAQQKWDEATGKLGETLAPAANKIKEFGADAILWVAKQLEKATKAIKEFKENVSSFDEKLWHDRSPSGSKKPPKPDKSHAGGLRRVPYDGYVAELHADEAVLTAREAETWRIMQRVPSARPSPATSADVYGAAAATVNGLNLRSQGGSEKFVGEITLKAEDGQTLGRYMVPFVRREDKSNPKVVSDRL